MTQQRGPLVTPPDDDPDLPRPNLVIAGVAKAGTTSLFRYLAQHPDVAGSTVKEPRYFTPVRYGEPLGSMREYSALVAHGADRRYRMEATPGYFPGGAAVAQAIDSVLPGTRVVVLFRDPVQRCWSWYRFVKSYARIPKELSFADYLDRCLELHEQGVDHLRENQPFWGVGGGCYDRWIDEWLTVYGDRLHVGFFEDLVARPREFTEDVCRWLDLPTEPVAELGFHVENQTVQYKNPVLQRLALGLNRGGESFFARHPALKRRLRGAYYRVNADTAKERMDEASADRLAAFYAPHDQRLAASLRAAGHDRLPAWLTETGRTS